VATKPKTAWLRKAPRGFALAFLRVDQAVAPNGSLCRALKPRLESHLAPKSLGLTLTLACRSPTVASWHHRGRRQPGQPTSPQFECALRFNPLAAQPALPRPAKPFWLHSPLTACSLSPAACGFTAGLSASPLPRPTRASAARRACPTTRQAKPPLPENRHGWRAAQPRPLNAGLGKRMRVIHLHPVI